MIEIKNLSKSYPTADGTVHAVKNVSLAIDKGDIFGVIGLSGAGKSTLVRCINFLEKPTEGNVIFGGVDLGQLNKKELLKERQKMSMIFQGFNLLSQRTALKNICYPLEIANVPKKEARARAMELLELVGLSDKATAYPAQLSGGQKQRIAIARALATNPDVLLCDEATSALDPKTTDSILSLLKSINEKLGVTIIIITHEMKVVEKICSKVAVMAEGNIVESGYVRDVFVSPQSEIARNLIMPQPKSVQKVEGERIVRIVFDGQSSSLPVISNLSLECRTAVNILGADTKNLDGKAYGQMVLQLPDSVTEQTRIFNYFTEHGIKYEEVQGV